MLEKQDARRARNGRSTDNKDSLKDSSTSSTNSSAQSTKEAKVTRAIAGSGAIGRFISNNFLSPKVLSAKIREVDPAGGMARWLSNPANANRVARRVTTALPQIVRALPRDEINGFLARAARSQRSVLVLERGRLVLQEIGERIKAVNPVGICRQQEIGIDAL